MPLKQLIKRSKELYPTSEFMRRQWVRKSFHLYATGRHLLKLGNLRNS